MIILLLFFNILREPGHGLHATKSWMCLVSSSIIFIGAPLVCKLITIPFIVKIVLGIYDTGTDKLVSIICDTG